MRKSILLSAAAAAMSLGVAGCDRRADGAGDAAGSSAAVEAVKRTEQAMLQEMKSANAAKVAAYYANDAAVMFPGDKPTEGSQAIAKRYDAMMADKAFALDIVNARTTVAASGDLAYTRGTYRATYTDLGSKQPVSETGNYVTVFKKQTDGNWKIVEDISAPGFPEAAAAAAAAPAG